MSGADKANSFVSGKLALKYVGDEVDAMKEIAEPSHERSVAQFESTLKKLRELFVRNALNRVTQRSNRKIRIVSS